MSRIKIILTNRFSEVKAYVKNGLPKDHWSRDNENFEGHEGPQKVWFDTDSSTGEHEYDQYEDVDVRDAARFRDGLVSDSDVYKEFREDFGWIWKEEYKKYSEIVYRHQQGASQDTYPLCSPDAHTFHENNGLCNESIDQINLMRFHIDSIEG
jgi:hypothetical protein